MISNLKLSMVDGKQGLDIYVIKSKGMFTKQITSFDSSRWKYFMTCLQNMINKQFQRNFFWGVIIRTFKPIDGSIGKTY